METAIEKWLKKACLPRLPVLCSSDFYSRPRFNSSPEAPVAQAKVPQSSKVRTQVMGNNSKIHGRSSSFQSTDGHTPRSNPSGILHRTFLIPQTCPSSHDHQRPWSLSADPESGTTSYLTHQSIFERSSMALPLLSIYPD